MPRYEYECPHCGTFDRWFEMGTAPEETLCSIRCTTFAKRVYSFYHQEDRRHMRSGLSPATGKCYAQSRDEERAIEKQSGIYFAGKSDLLQHERDAIAYQKHVASGGDRMENAVSVPQEPDRPLRDYMREMNYKRHEFPAESFTKEHQDKQYREILDKAAQA